MSVMHDSTLADPDRLIADLQRQLVECRAELDKALGERDEAQRRLAECTAERDEALEQQAATAEVLHVINSSPGDLTPVFDAMLEKATRLCDGACGILWTYHGEFFRAVAIRGAPPGFAEFLREPMPRLSRRLGDLVRGRALVHVEDMAKPEAYLAGNRLQRATVDLAGARTGVIAALRKDNDLLGAFVIYRREILPFSDKQVALLGNLAAQAVIAMDNARLLIETREGLEHQTATAEVLQVINASQGNLGPMFDGC